MSPQLRGKVVSAFHRSKESGIERKESGVQKSVVGRSGGGGLFKSKLKASTLHSIEYEAMNVPL